MTGLPQPQRFRREGARKLRRPYGARRKPRPLRSGGRRARSDLGPPRSFSCKDYLVSGDPYDFLLPRSSAGAFRPTPLPAITLTLGPGWAEELGLVLPDACIWERLNALRNQIFHITGLPLPAVAVSPCLSAISEWGVGVFFGMQPMARAIRESDPDRAPLPFELLSQAVRQDAALLLTEDMLVNMLVEVARRYRAMTSLLGSRGLFVPLLDVLRFLLAELVSIRDLVRIVEAMLDSSRLTREPHSLLPYVRAALGRQIVDPHLKDGKLTALVLSPHWEGELWASVINIPQGQYCSLDPTKCAELRAQVGKALEACPDTRPVLLATSHVRLSLRRLIAPSYPDLAVLGQTELPAGCPVDLIGRV